MKFRVPKEFIFEFSDRLLTEAGVEEETIEVDLESFIYEAGERWWDEYEDEDGDKFYFIDFDI